MPTPFDAERWRIQAARRFRKDSDDGKLGAALRYLRDQRAIPGIATLVEWAPTAGLSIIFKRMRNGSWDANTRSLLCSNRMCSESQLFVLLHECGHYKVGQPKPNERFGNGYATSDPDVKDNILHRVDVVDEELTAWSLGLELAKELEIDVDIVRYNQLKAKYVKGYMKWALQIGDYELDEEEDDA